MLPWHCVGTFFFSIQINNSGHDSSPAPPAPASASSSSSSAASKWACAMCTYLNWPKAHKCVQCYTVRKRVSPSSMSPRSATPASSASLQAAAEQHCIASMNKAFEQVILSSTQVSQIEGLLHKSKSFNYFEFLLIRCKTTKNVSMSILRIT